MVQATTYNGELIVASRGSMTGYVNQVATPLFTDEIVKYLDSYNEWTFLFEVLDPDHPIVIRHDKLELVLLALRNKITGEYSFGDLIIPGIRNNEYHELTPEIWEAISFGENTEGAVLSVGNELYKYKTEWYVQAHNILTDKRPKDFLLAWAEDRLDDVIGAMRTFYREDEAQQVLDEVQVFADELQATVIRMSEFAATQWTPKDVALGISRDSPLEAITFGEVMKAFRGGYITDIGKIFNEVKSNLSESKIKHILEGS